MPAHRIIGLSMVKNEQDLVEPFVRHNLQFLDQFVVVDNASSDQTRPILRQLSGEFENLTCLDDPTFGYTQSQRTTALLHKIQARERADFVVFIDADEFILADNRDAFAAALAESIPSGGAGGLPWRTYVLTPETAEEAAHDPPRTIRWRRAIEQPLFYKSILRLDGAERPDLVVGQGAHRIWKNSKAIERKPLQGLHLAHFPIRSREQLTSKVIVGWAACLRANLGATNLSYQWRDNFESLVRGEIADSNTLAEASFRYTSKDTAPIDWQSRVVFDPAPFSYERKYSTGAFADPIAIIARAWQHQLTTPA